MNAAATVDDYLAELAEQRRQSPHTVSNYRRDLTRLLALAAAVVAAGTLSAWLAGRAAMR